MSSQYLVETDNNNHPESILSFQLFSNCLSNSQRVHILRLGRRGVCVFVESGRTDEIAPRDGGFPTALTDLGFVHYTRTDGFEWYSDSAVADWFCIGSDDTVALPATTSSDTVHGICTL